MTIILNGQERDISNTTSLSTLVSSMIKKPEHVIAELNGQIIPREQWDNLILKQGDVLELVTFVGGG